MLLGALLAVLTILVLHRLVTAERQKTAPLTYTRGATVSSPVRRGAAVPGAAADPVALFLERRLEKYPGVVRDLFHLSGSGETPRPKPDPVTKPAPTVQLPAVPVRSAEEIAADAARADISRFRFLGYLTDKDSSLFLSKDGELFIAKSGDALVKTYRIKSAGREHVILYDTVTRVEVRIELAGGEGRAK